MVDLRNVVLDVLKPHSPNALEFASHLGQALGNVEIHVKVVAVDDKTQSIALSIRGCSLDFAIIETKIQELGGSVHSIDEVLVVSENDVQDSSTNNA